MIEFEMRMPVAKWLVGQGLTPYLELASMRNCDLAGVLWGIRVGRAIPPIQKIVAVELKLVDVAGVLRQCRSHKWTAHEVYAVMPKSRVDMMHGKTLNMFLNDGIGLVSFYEGEFDVKIQPAWNEIEISPRAVKTLWARRHSCRERMNNPLMLRAEMFRRIKAENERRSSQIAGLFSSFGSEHD